MTWKGKKRTHKPTPVPPEAGAGVIPAGLQGASCTSANACTAVSYALYYATLQSGPVYVPYTDAWNGKTWTLEPD